MLFSYADGRLCVGGVGGVWVGEMQGTSVLGLELYISMRVLGFNGSYRDIHRCVGGVCVWVVWVCVWVVWVYLSIGDLLGRVSSKLQQQLCHIFPKYLEGVQYMT